MKLYFGCGIMVDNNLNPKELYENFVNLHRHQLELLKVPLHFWDALCFKCSNLVFDAGSAFSFEEVEDNLAPETKQNVADDEIFNNDMKICVIKEDGILPDNKDNIYLIDHAYTYCLPSVRNDLLEDENLRSRMAKLMGIPAVNSENNVIVDSILREMWRYNQGYAFTSDSVIQQITPKLKTLWYIMDEFGSKIRHSPEPSFKTVPFFHLGLPKSSYTLLFPVKKLKFGDEVTRNYIEGEYDDKLTYQALMLPWEYTDFTMIDFCPKEPNVSFIQSGRIEESVPYFQYNSKCKTTHHTGKLKVFSEYKVINKNLKHQVFELVSNDADADILWLTGHYKKFRELSDFPHKYINQFPFEHIVTCKNLLAIVCRRTMNKYISDNTAMTTNPPWLPTTYNLHTELSKFVSFFQQRKKRGLDNIWICKPWNLSRGQDIHVTDNLNYILKLRSTGPKIACKYITDPVLFPVKEVGLVKMDIRYIVLLKSVKPLQLYSYKYFWLRFANKPFSLDSFEDYEKHFTVMNYGGSFLKQMYSDEFIRLFEEYYKPQKWNDIEMEIFRIFKDIFAAATLEAPPAGIFQNSQSRAMYGIDLMLQWDRTESEKPRMQPVILEVNFAPDCERACQYYSAFFDDVFDALFLEKEDHSNVVLL